MKAVLLLLSHLSYNNKNNKNRFFGGVKRLKADTLYCTITCQLTVLVDDDDFIELGVSIYLLW